MVDADTCGHYFWEQGRRSWFQLWAGEDVPTYWRDRVPQQTTGWEGMMTPSRTRALGQGDTEPRVTGRTKSFGQSDLETGNGVIQFEPEPWKRKNNKQVNRQTKKQTNKKPKKWGNRLAYNFERFPGRKSFGWGEWEFSSNIKNLSYEIRTLTTDM